MALTNKDDHKDDHKDHHKYIYIEIFGKLAKEKFDEIKDLTYEINHDYFKYYFKNDTAQKRFDDFNNGIERFRKIQSGEMKLEEVKKHQNVFKSILNEMSRGRFKSEGTTRNYF